jgi:hypothetical protein
LDLDSYTTENEFWDHLKEKLTPKGNEDSWLKNIDKKTLLKAFLTEKGYE